MGVLEAYTIHHTPYTMMMGVLEAFTRMLSTAERKINQELEDGEPKASHIL